MNVPASGTPGWYPDPTGRFEVRFHNGAAWTADVASDGERFVDPLGAAGNRPPEHAPEHAPERGPARRNRAATTALVLGIVALGTGWIPFVFALGALSAVLAVAFGVAGLRRAGPDGSGRGTAIAGVVTGATGLVVSVGGLLLTIVVLDAVDRYDNPAPFEARVVECTRDGRTVTFRGELTNVSDDRADYTVRTDFVRTGTDNPYRTARVRLDDVGAGETVEFETARELDQDDVDCAIGAVNGPPPFGIELGP